MILIEINIMLSLRFLVLIYQENSKQSKKMIPYSNDSFRSIVDFEKTPFLKN
jgi:hypothetical protein